MKPNLGLRVSQHLALTPALQQSIRLLQMSTAELEQEIEKFIAENPLLETSESLTGQSEGADFLDQTSKSDNLSAPDTAEEQAPGQAESWSGTSGARAHQDDDDHDWSHQRAQPIRLQDYLHEQSMALSLSERDRIWLDVLIESLDDDGYLRETLAEIEAAIGESFEELFGSRLDADEMELGLTLLQSMDPPGVGARSLSECLLIQLAKTQDPTQDPSVALAQRIVGSTAYLERLARHDFQGLCKMLGCDREALKAAQELIQSLDPRPGKRFQADETQTVIPDVIAYKSESSSGTVWRVRLNSQAVPRLSVNPAYARLISQDRGHAMASQLQEARWMIKNIEQRFDTILRVAQAIAKEQQLFFEQGELAMKPLVLREVAHHCELHESTVSRVTTNKYILTPKGTFELKYFFTSHVATDTGGTASSTAIRARIKQWISQEDGRKPLSDQQLADRFAQEGIQVARRTIAKYREALRIDPVSQRKKL
jgi:RNA polymerase sigma-54 factor